jgi:hypothetical protein
LKSDGALSQESTQVSVPEVVCGTSIEGDQERLGVLLGVPAICDRDLALLIASWPQLPEHVRSTISTLVKALRRRRPAPHAD